MTVKRIVPNIRTADLEASRAFYGEVLGLKVAMDMGWIVTFLSPEHPSAQLSLLSEADGEALHPDITIEVADVDACHDRAVAWGLSVCYPLTDELWGVRRFFLEDPNGKIVNVMSHRSES